MLGYRQISGELRLREVCRTSNSPTGDIAEYLFRETFDWELEPNSKAGYDAVCPKLGRIQIKSRFLAKSNSSRQAGDIRQLSDNKFDWLGGVVFGPEADILTGLMIPHAAVLKRALAIKHTNSSRIYLRDDWLQYDGVYSVRKQLGDKWAELNQ